MKCETYIEKNIPSLEGKNVLITGANSGIGFEAATIFASKGARVLLACRNEKKAEIARNKILSLYPNSQVEIYLYDQSSLTSIEKMANEIQRKETKIDVTICNAGIFHPKASSYTEDGFPLTIGTNYIGCFYLVQCLLPFLEENKEGRLIFVSSLTYRLHKKLNEKYLLEEEKNVSKSYGASKSYIVRMFLYYVEHSSLKVFLMHPGVASTNIFSSQDTKFPKWFISLAHKVLPLFTHSPKKASLGMLYLASNEVSSGCFVEPRGIGSWCGFPRKRKIEKAMKKDVERLYEDTQKLILERRKVVC